LNRPILTLNIRIYSITIIGFKRSHPAVYSEYAMVNVDTGHSLRVLAANTRANVKQP